MAPSTSRDNTQWLVALAGAGGARGGGAGGLCQSPGAGPRRGLGAWLDPHSDQLATLAEEASQEALVRILDRLDTFEGRSRFTTWAYKVAFRIALTDLRRKQWQGGSLAGSL